MIINLKDAEHKMKPSPKGETLKMHIKYKRCKCESRYVTSVGYTPLLWMVIGS